MEEHFNLPDDLKVTVLKQASRGIYNNKRLPNLSSFTISEQWVHEGWVETQDSYLTADADFLPPSIPFCSNQANCDMHYTSSCFSTIIHNTLSPDRDIKTQISIPTFISPKKALTLESWYPENLGTGLKSNCLTENREVFLSRGYFPITNDNPEPAICLRMPLTTRTGYGENITGECGHQSHHHAVTSALILALSPKIFQQNVKTGNGKTYIQIL